jgi:hypothetical protein
VTNSRYLQALQEYIHSTVNKVEKSGSKFVFSGNAQGPFYGCLIDGGPHKGRRKRAYWDNEKQVIIIRDPTAESRGTVFVSTPEYRDRVFPYNWNTMPKAKYEASKGDGQMEAYKLPDGRVDLVLPAGQEYTLSHHYRLHCFLGEALFALRHTKNRCEALLGVSYEEARSLDEELFLIRYDVLRVPRPAQESNRKLWSLVVPGRTGTDWEHQPKVETKLMANATLGLTFGRQELSILAKSIDVALEDIGAKRSKGGRIEFVIRTSTAPEDAEMLRDELIGMNKRMSTIS